MARDSRGRFIGGSGGKGTRLIDRDLGAKAIMRNIRAAMRGRVVDVGVQGSEAGAAHGDTAASNVEIATFHEYGTRSNPERKPLLPERSFIRATVDKHGPRYRGILRAEAAKVVAGERSVDDSLGLLGQQVVADMRATIRAHIPPPLSEETIAAKGSSTPLIDTGQLMGSLTAVVRDASGGSE